jgi:hypothetical protein
MLKKYLLTTKDDKHNIPVCKDKNNIIYLTTGKGVQHMTNLEHNMVIPFIKRGTNVRTYLAGNSGCGKSSYIRNYIKIYHRLYPDQDIYIFSILENDPSLDAVEHLIQRIDIDNIEDYEVKDFKDCLAIFDDYVGLPAKKQKVLNYYKNILLKTGRHHGVDVITCTDKLLDGVHSIKDIQHSQYVVVFPQTGGNSGEIISFLKNKLGFNNDNVNKIVDNDTSIWVAIHKTYPFHVITDNEIYLIKK